MIDNILESEDAVGEEGSYSYNLSTLIKLCRRARAVAPDKLEDLKKNMFSLENELQSFDSILGAENERNYISEIMNALDQEDFQDEGDTFDDIEFDEDDLNDDES